jgi:hypothetical protein
VTDDPKLRRANDNPGALISTDRAGLAAYKKKKAAFGQINRIAVVEQELSDVKMMLKELLERLDK